MNEFQPAWGHVITSKEQEKSLHAYTCQKCGTTVFIAKGREFRFFNKFVQCLNCGATGQKNFVDTRDEIVELADEGDFIYESPVNYKLSTREKRKLEEAEAKEAEERKVAEEAEAVSKTVAKAVAEALEKEAAVVADVVVDAEVVAEEAASTPTTTIDEAAALEVEPVAEEEKPKATKTSTSAPAPAKADETETTPVAAVPKVEAKAETTPAVTVPKAAPKASAAAPKPKAKPVSRTPSAPSGDGMDILDMD
jgi:predicted RNA-binding Zn-ribbon protein involved in translation (DUF1610 family)